MYINNLTTRNILKKLLHRVSTYLDTLRRDYDKGAQLKTEKLKEKKNDGCLVDVSSPLLAFYNAAVATLSGRNAVLCGS